LLQRATTEILGDDRVSGLRFAWDDDLETDMVVISAGIRPEVSLADSMGVEVGRAILVDDAMRTSVPGVWAVGECAEHRGTVHGLWAPIREQAKVAGASIAGLPAAFHGAIPVTSLKVAEIELFCAGVHSTESDAEDEVSTIDTRSGVYRKLIVRDDRLIGAILLGDTSLGPRLADLMRRGVALPPGLFGGDFACDALDDYENDDMLVCTCMSVTRGKISAAVDRHNLTDVEAVRQLTGAGSGCGSCRRTVASLLRRVSR
jgi:ferredoxin-nitrate reductase